MSALSDWLKRADPLNDERLPSEAHLHLVRSRVVASARARRGAVQWKKPVWIAAVAGLVLVAVASMNRLPGPDASAPASVRDGTVPEGAPEPQRRQLQFATSGGTRVIWIFNSEFDVRGGSQP
jgi:hypothetical protein